MHIAERTALAPLVRVSQVTREICGLPAVATLDWCDRAAACLCPAGEPAVAMFILGQIGERGEIGSREAVGVAATPPSGPEESVLTGLRSRGHRLSSVGLQSLDLTRLTIAVMDRAAPDWRHGPVGRMIGGQCRGDLVAAVAPLAAESRRMVVVYLACPGPGTEAATVLEATLPLLLSRAATSLGADRECTWLTLREQEVLEQLTLGKSVKDIAESLGRSPHTVHDHVKALHRKLSARTRGELIARALGHLPGRRPAALVEPKAGLRVAPGAPLTRAG